MEPISYYTTQVSVNLQGQSPILESALGPHFSDTTSIITAVLKQVTDSSSQLKLTVTPEHLYSALTTSMHLKVRVVPNQVKSPQDLDLLAFLDSIPQSLFGNFQSIYQTTINSIKQSLHQGLLNLIPRETSQENPSSDDLRYNYLRAKLECWFALNEAKNSNHPLAGSNTQKFLMIAEIEEKNNFLGIILKKPSSLDQATLIQQLKVQTEALESITNLSKPIVDSSSAPSDISESSPQILQDDSNKMLSSSSVSKRNGFPIDAVNDQSRKPIKSPPPAAAPVASTSEANKTPQKKPTEDESKEQDILSPTMKRNLLGIATGGSIAALVAGIVLIGLGAFLEAPTFGGSTTLIITGVILVTFFAPTSVFSGSMLHGARKECKTANTARPKPKQN